MTRADDVAATTFDAVRESERLHTLEAISAAGDEQLLW